jgi:pentatricopeptide repeat protein
MTPEYKRTSALGLIGECSTHLRTMSDAQAVREMVAALTDRAWALQGDPRDRPYLTRTMSQLAHVLRSHGWVEIACSTLEWTIEHGAQDGHVLSEVAECHLARGDLKGAEAILERARAAGVATDAIYTSLVKAQGRSGQPERARQMFERAKADGAVTTFTYPALIAAYGAAGDVAGASRIFESARADGQLSAPAFTALASALAGAGDMAAVERLLQMARESGHMSARLAYAAIRGRLNNQQFGAARRLLEDAKREGMADVQCYQAIIAACHRAGRHREAKRVYASAASDPLLPGEDLRRVKSAHGRRGAAPAPAEAPRAA